MGEPRIIISGEGGYSYEMSLLQMDRLTRNFLLSFFFFSTIIVYVRPRPLMTVAISVLFSIFLHPRYSSPVHHPNTLT